MAYMCNGRKAVIITENHGYRKEVERKHYQRKVEADEGGGEAGVFSFDE